MNVSAEKRQSIRALFQKIMLYQRNTKLIKAVNQKASQKLNDTLAFSITTQLNPLQTSIRILSTGFGIASSLCQLAVYTCGGSSWQLTTGWRGENIIALEIWAETWLPSLLALANRSTGWEIILHSSTFTALHQIYIS